MIHWRQVAAAVYIDLHTSNQQQHVRLSGRWTIDQAQALERRLKQLQLAPHPRVVIDSRGVESLDLTGGWQILRLFGQLQQRGLQVELIPDERLGLLRELYHQGPLEPPPVPRPAWWSKPVIAVGQWSISKQNDVAYMLVFLGRALTTLLGSLLQPHKLHFGAISQQIYQTGILAVPIVCLIAFLISIVLAYQGAHQLRQFGADIFTIDLVAVSVLREMGVLLTAIMVAGRSGSAFAAQLGVMKINEEMDAMRTIGLDPFRVLVVPRILGLIIALPLLTVLANLMGLAGGAMLSNRLLDIPFEQFLVRLEEAVVLSTWWVGLVKAPVFAFIIAFVGTLRGMQVSGSAEHLGHQTTVSVVQSIFLVIMADAIFSIIFSELGI